MTETLYEKKVSYTTWLMWSHTLGIYKYKSLIKGDIMGGTKRLWEDSIDNEVGDYVDGIIPRDKVSEDAEAVYDLDNEDVSYKSLNVRVSVYEQIKRIAKEDNRTIASTVALMVKENLKNRRI